MMMPSLKFSDLIVVHPEFCLGFFKTLLIDHRRPLSQTRVFRRTLLGAFFEGQLNKESRSIADMAETYEGGEGIDVFLKKPSPNLKEVF
jgi:hypothetical protein